MEIINHINHDPEHGAGVTFLSVSFALLIKFFIEFNIVSGDHINPIIMDSFQLGAWGVAILVGTLTAVSYLKKIFSKNKDGK